METNREIKLEDREKLLESINISQVMVMLQNHDIEGDVVLSEYLEAIHERQNELRQGKKYGDMNTLESMEGIIRDAISAGYLNTEMTINQAMGAFSVRYNELKDELDKKGLRF